MYRLVKYFIIMVTFCSLVFLLSCSSSSSKKQDSYLRYKNYEKFYLIGNKSYNKGKYQKAVNNFNIYIDKSGFVPETETALYRLTLSYFHLGKYSHFFKTENHLLRWFPKTSYRKILKDLHWEVYYRSKKYRISVKEIKKYLNTNNVDEKRESFIRYHLAEAYKKIYQLKYYIKQLSIISRFKTKSKYQSLSLLNLSNWFFIKNDRELALYYINQLFKRFRGYRNNEKALNLKRNIRWNFIVKKNGLGDNSISSITFDGDDVWVGTWLGGITRFTRSTGKSVLFKTDNSGIASNLVRNIAIENTRVWTATFAGLSFYDKKVDKWKTVYSVAGIAYQRIKALLIDDQKLWVATIAHGLSVLDFKTGKWTTYLKRNGLPGDNVVALCATPGSIWVGTVTGGIGRYDKNTGKWQTYSHGKAGGLPSNNIKAIAFDGTKLWIGTHGQGAASCDENGGDWSIYNTGNSGLTSNYVYTVKVAPDGKIWMGTLEGGACVYNRISDKWKKITTAEGLSSNDVTTIEFEGRYIWFGTLNGGISIFLRDGGKNAR